MFAQEILLLPLETQAEKMEDFNLLRTKLTNPRLKPISEEAYDLWWDIYDAISSLWTSILCEEFLSRYAYEIL